MTRWCTASAEERAKIEELHLGLNAETAETVTPEEQKALIEAAKKQTTSSIQQAPKYLSGPHTMQWLNGDAAKRAAIEAKYPEEAKASTT